MEGFRVYHSNAPFTDVGTLIPLVELGSNVTDHLLEGLDRTLDHYFAVVAFNRNEEQIDAVTPVVWTDPLAGVLEEDYTIGGAGESVPIYAALEISGGATLTLLPGTTLSFAPGAGLTVNNGILNAAGTALQPIHFTSLGEFASPPTAARGDWAGLVLEDPTNVSILRHVWIRFGSGLLVRAGTFAIDHVYAVQNAVAGFKTEGVANLTARECFLVYNALGATAGGGSSLNLGNSILKGNTSGNASQSDTATFTAANNWWGGPAPGGIQGVVETSSPLSAEPVLGAAFQVKDGVAQTGSRPITLFIQSANAVGYRFDENSSFPSSVFESLFNTDDDFRISPYGFELPFTLTAGAGLKTVHAQLRSETDTAGPNLSTTVTLVTSGPVVNNFSLVEGQEIGRPLTVTASASAPLGLLRIDFLVNGSLVARSSSTSLSVFWDPRTLSPGIARAEILAVDRNGVSSTRALNIVIRPVGPSKPVITSPVEGLVTNVSPLTVQGTAEPGVSLQLKRNGEVVAGSVTAAANGSFSIPGVTLVEGTNSLVATASDFLGSSASSAVNITFDSGPPDAPLLLALERQRNGTLVDWSYQGVEQPTHYRIYWNQTTFTDPDAASNSTGDLTATGGRFNLGDGTWFVGVAAFDGAGNRSEISNLGQINVDFTAPVLTVTFDQAMPVGPGALGIRVDSSEPLQSLPTLTIRSQGASSPVPVSLTQQTSTQFTGTFQVTTLSSNSGVATLRASATDLAGNSFSGVPGGVPLVFDVTKPTAIVVLDRPTPVQTTSNTTLSVGFTLSEALAGGVAPVMSFEPPVGPVVAIPVAGSGVNWSGQLTVNAAMGSGQGFFRFLGTDAVGNEGTVVSSGEILELYNTATPPPPALAPVLTGAILSEGRIRLNWQAVPRAESYKLYREAGSEGGTPTLIIQSGIEALTFTDLPPADGIYRYALVASLRGADGPPSGVLVAESDRVPPEPVTNLSVELLSRGVEVSFNAPASGAIPSSYRIYRGATLIRQLPNPGLITDFPPRGSHEYRVASVDQYGNENLSDAIIIDLLVSPVRDLHLHARKGSANALTWSNADPTVIGYHLYRDNVKQNGAPLAVGAFVDPLGASGRRVIYEVTAVNAVGNESPRRRVEMFPVDLSVLINERATGGDGRSTVGYFDRLKLTISNQAALGDLGIEGLAINRSVSGQDDLSQNHNLNRSVTPGGSVIETVVVPAPLTPDLVQNFQIILEGAADAGGSRVTYEFQTVKDAARVGNNQASLTTEDVPVAGANANVQVTLSNLGGADMDIVLGRAGGLQPGDLSIVVLDANGEIVSRKEFKGPGASGLITIGDGNLVARIEPGKSYTFNVPDVLIPEYLGELGQGATLALEINGLFSRFGSALQISQQGVIGGSTFTNLIETPYFANLSTDKNAYANDEEILISGQAITRATGLPQPNSPLRIGFGVRS